MTSPLDGLDPTLNQPKRLAAIAMIAASTSCDFTFLRDQLQLIDSDLSRHMAALGQAGYVTIRKSGRGRGHTTTYAITKSGRAAYGRHRDTLTALLATHEAPVDGSLPTQESGPKGPPKGVESARPAAS